MDEDDDLYAKLYGEEAPKRQPVIEKPKLEAEEGQPRVPVIEEPESQGPTEANKPSTSSAFNLVQADEPGVSTFDDDDDDFEIHLDKIEPQAADDEDDLEIRLDSRKDSAPSGQPPTPPGISSVHKYVRPGGEQAAARKPPQAQQSEDASQAAPAAAAPPGLQPMKRPPSYPTYDPSDPGVLPSQANAQTQRIRLPGQTRVTPEEYKEFLCLGHGDIFHLDIDRVIDAPWYQPGADPADFFNYGMNPRTWKEHCAAVQKFQTEFTMQRQIEVYDRDGRVRSSQSDLPPELAAAVAQRKAAEGQGFVPIMDTLFGLNVSAASSRLQDRSGNGHAGSYQDRHRSNPSGQRALPFSRWHGQEGNLNVNASKPTSNGTLPLPPFGALEWNASSGRPDRQGDPQLLASKRRKMDAG